MGKRGEKSSIKMLTKEVKKPLTYILSCTSRQKFTGLLILKMMQ